MKKKMLFAVLLLLSMVTLLPYAASVTPEKKEAIDRGVVWLAAQQGGDGSWWCSMHGEYPVTATAFAVIKLCEHAKKGFYIEGEYMDPFDEAYPYREHIIKGLNYIFRQAVPIDINIEHGVDNPDVNLVNGQGIYFNSPGQNRPLYETGIVMMALEASCHRDFIVGEPDSPVNGWTYLAVMKDVVDYVSWAQNDPDNPGRGGWRYGAYDDGIMVGPGFGAPHSDNSVSQWPVLGLMAAEAWGVFVPPWVKTELLIWLAYSQGGDGCFGYTGPGSYTASGPFGVTASGLIQLSYCGVPSDDPKWLLAAQCICTNWGLHNIGNIYAMYGLMKAAMTAIPEPVWVFCGQIEWQPEYDAWLLANQHIDGYWEADGYWADRMLATEWALLILQKIAPPPPTIEVFVDIKPCSWPNPINVRSGGKFAVAILGTEEFDVMTIDPATVEIQIEGVEGGVSPLRWSYEDVATPYEGERPGGHAVCGDGYMDLVFHFKTQEVVDILGLNGFDDGEMVTLIITGNLFEEYDGRAIRGEDYVRIIEKQ